MGKIFLRGLLGLAPIIITIALIAWLYRECEKIFSVPIKALVGPEYYFNGLGVIVAIIVLFLVGLVLNNWIIQHFYQWFHRMMKRVPFVKTVYNAVCDLMSFFQSGKKNASAKVVAVEINGMRLIAMVSRETFDDLPEGIGYEDEVVVYIPLSYQIGGVMAIIKRSQIKPIDMGVEAAMRFVVTGGSPAQAED